MIALYIAIERAKRLGQIKGWSIRDIGPHVEVSLFGRKHGRKYTALTFEEIEAELLSTNDGFGRVKEDKLP